MTYGSSTPVVTARAVALPVCSCHGYPTCTVGFRSSFSRFILSVRVGSRLSHEGRPGRMVSMTGDCRLSKSGEPASCLGCWAAPAWLRPAKPLRSARCGSSVNRQEARWDLGLQGLGLLIVMSLDLASSPSWWWARRRPAGCGSSPRLGTSSAACSSARSGLTGPPHRWREPRRTLMRLVMTGPLALSSLASGVEPGDWMARSRRRAVGPVGSRAEEGSWPAQASRPRSGTGRGRGRPPTCRWGPQRLSTSGSPAWSVPPS
jgi:hypothetical protein